MSRSKSIRNYCKWCMNGYSPKDCTSDDCYLYEHNTGKTVKDPKMKMKDAIKARCKDCQPDSPRNVTHCTEKSCHLHIYRLGAKGNALKYDVSTHIDTF